MADSLIKMAHFLFFATQVIIPSKSHLCSKFHYEASWEVFDFSPRGDQSCGACKV